ncbi:MAG: hypothetical protein WCO06_01400 [Candidatus Roizmanbacteria bacterium]
MTLSELLVKIKEKSLSQEQLESYGDEMSALFSQMQLEMADLEKEEALFLDHCVGAEDKISVAESKIKWKATPKGQRLIVLKRYSVATKEMINSLKSRTFRLIK